MKHEILVPVDIPGYEMSVGFGKANYDASGKWILTASIKGARWRSLRSLTGDFIGDERLEKARLGRGDNHGLSWSIDSSRATGKAGSTHISTKSMLHSVGQRRNFLGVQLSMTPMRKQARSFNLNNGCSWLARGLSVRNTRTLPLFKYYIQNSLDTDFWCREGGSNPHDHKGRQILSLLRLPVPPSRLSW